MVRYNENDRPNIDQILNNHWFDEIKNLDNQQLAQLNTEVQIEFLALTNLLNQNMNQINNNNINNNNNNGNEN